MAEVLEGEIRAEPNMWFRGQYGRAWHRVSRYSVRFKPDTLWGHVLTHAPCGYFDMTKRTEQIQQVKPKATLCKQCERRSVRDEAPVDNP